MESIHFPYLVDHQPVIKDRNEKIIMNGLTLFEDMMNFTMTG